MKNKNIYSLSVNKKFAAYHYLVGGNWGAENKKHKHVYTAYIELKGKTLDKHGFLIDIVELDEKISVLFKKFENNILNDLSEFNKINPSIEHFARIICEKIAMNLPRQIDTVIANIQEDSIATASFSKLIK